MNDFKNIRTLLNKIVSDPNIQYIADSKELSELIKLIPYFGGLIESRTLGNVRDKKLENRLLEIEKNFDDILTIDDGHQILDLVLTNSNMLYSFIGNFKNELFNNNQELLIEIKKYLMIPQGGDTSFQPHKGFHFVIISGASATGKDSLLNNISQESFKGFTKNEILRKYTTRKKRITDSLYYDFVTQKQYQKLFDDDKLIFPFSKRRNKYGFDKTQLLDSTNENTLLFCIYTEFYSLHQTMKTLNELNINTTFILLEADINEITERSWGRNFPIDEINSRINSAKRDIKFIKKNNEIIKDVFDYRIYSGNDKSKNDLIREVIRAIKDNTEAK